MKIIDIMVLMLTLAVSGLLLLAYLAGRINPNDFWWPALLGLAAPVLYMANTVLTLYWTVRWKVYLFIPLATILLGAGHITSFFRPQLSKH